MYRVVRRREYENLVYDCLKPAVSMGRRVPEGTGIRRAEEEPASRRARSRIIDVGDCRDEWVVLTEELEEAIRRWEEIPAASSEGVRGRRRRTGEGSGGHDAGGAVGDRRRWARV